MPYCRAKYCTAAYENNPSNAHFHRLPQRCALRRQWLAKSGRPPGQDKQARVCSLHFMRDDYDNLYQYESGFASKAHSETQCRTKCLWSTRRACWGGSCVRRNKRKV